MQQVTVTPLSDITPIMSGTTAPWHWEAEAVYVNGVSTAFSWSAGVLSVPSYTGGIVLVEYTLYLLYDAPSQNLPSDPTDPLSPVVYWENRLSQFISFSNSMKAFETGLSDINVGSIGIHIDDEWIGLIQQMMILANRVIRIYRGNVLSFKGIATKHSVNGYTINVNVQKRIKVFDSECNFGDPPYLNRIDRTSVTAYYNGASIPEQFEGVVIPMLFGPEFPYDQTEYQEIDIGPVNPAFLGIGGSDATKFSQKGLQTSSFCVKVIPTSASVGIIGRMPSYQSLVSSPSNITFTSPCVPAPCQRFYKKSEQISNATIYNSVISGEILLLTRVSPHTGLNAARVWSRTPPDDTFVFLGTEDAAFDQYQQVNQFSPTEHWFCTRVPEGAWTLPAVASSALTPGLNRWITVNVTGINLIDNETYVVFTGITGSRSTFQVMQWILEKHGFTVDSASFAALQAEFTPKTIQQIGRGNDMPTVGDVIGEMNRTYMTALIFPESNDVPYIKKIDASELALTTLTDVQISDPVISNEYRTQAKNVLFRPLYARSDVYKYSLFRNKAASNAALFASEKTANVDHILQSVDSTSNNRFQAMANIYGSPVVTVNFELFDEDVTLELGDMVFIDHPKFKNKIMITSVENRPIGRAIQGRHLYVNSD